MRQKMIAILFCFCFCFSAQAERIVIVGKPIELIVHDGYFTLPDDYTQRRDYHFIKIANTDRICYLHEKPSLAGLPVLYVIIEEKGLQIRWVCYRYDPKYFELDY